MKGSGLFSGYAAKKPHLITGPGGLAAEIAELGSAAEGALAGLAFLAVEEWDAPPAASATALLAATASVNGTQTFTGSQLTQTAFAIAARNLVFTGGGTTGQCPTSAAISGFDAGGVAQTETVALTAGSGTGVKGWSKITKIVLTGGTGTAGTTEIGTGVVIGLSYVPQRRAGYAATYAPYFPEIVDGAVVAAATTSPYAGTGTLNATNKTYTPATAPNGTHKYCVYYDAKGS